MPSDSAYRHLSSAYGRNHFDIDRPLRSVLNYFTGRIPPLSPLGAFAGKELYEIADYVDKVARPREVMWSVGGDRVDEVWLEPGERTALERLSREFGVNRPPYRGGSWHDHYAALYLISDPGVACVLTVTNQTAYALYKYGSEEQKRLVPSLIGESEPIRYGATWFTELQGGSDLGANLVEASEGGGSWRLTGDTKYFASNAGLADFALVTARPRGAAKGAKGLGLFLVPRTDSQGKRNFDLRRLKDKSATASVPTGEVELHAAEATPVGDLRNGIYYTMENLMVSRLANCAGALGIARKAYFEAYYYAQKRSAFGKKLIEHPLVQRDLLDMEVCLEGSLALVFRAVDRFQKSWTEVPPYDEAYHYARLLTHVAKNVSAEMAAYVTKMAMELHGGVGFLKEYAVERLHREALITPIWEGSSNIQALDMLEAIAKKGAHLALIRDMEAAKVAERDRATAESATARAKAALDSLSRSDESHAQFYAKDTLSTIGHAVATVTLLEIGTKLSDARFLDSGRLYGTHFLMGEAYGDEVLSKAMGLIAVDRED